MDKEKKILVAYIGVGNIDNDDVEEYVYKVGKRIIPTSFDGEMIIVPIDENNSRIECINPKYITDEGLIFEHTIIMQELQTRLQHQISELKKEKKNG